MISLFRALRDPQMLTSVVGARMCMCIYQRDSCSLPGEDHIPTNNDTRPVNSNTPLRRKQVRLKWVIGSHVTFLYLSQEENFQFDWILELPTHNEFSEAAVSKFFDWHFYKKNIFNMPSNMQIYLFANYTHLTVTISYTVLIHKQLEIFKWCNRK